MNKSVEQLKVSTSAPLTLRLAKWLQRSKIRGGYKFEDFCLTRGLWNFMVRYTLENSVNIDIPLAYRPYDKDFLLNYEHLPIEVIARILGQSTREFTLLDCGADIGIFSSLIISKCYNIKTAIAFEPNKTSFSFLEHNLFLLPVEGRAYNKAVSNFMGNAELEFPDFDSHDHAAYIHPSEEGGIEVCSIDSLGLGKIEGLLLKVDVEGEELAVVKGAQQIIKEAKELVLLFEAHLLQVRRTEIDPISIISFVNSIRPCTVQVTEMPDRHIDLNIPFFDQFPGTKTLNVCLHSTT